MSLREAAARIGLPGAGREPARKLWRFLRAHERTTGKAATMRAGSRLYVTEASLRGAFPQMFDRRTEIERELRDELSRLNGAIAEARQQTRALAAKLREARARLDAIAETCGRSTATLARRVSRLEAHAR